MKKGFTLVELLVFVSILSLFFVTAVSVAVSSLRNLKINEHRILAIRYSEELSEWLQSQKEVDWSAFINHVHDNGCQPGNICTVTFCMNSLNWNTRGTCANNGLSPPIYQRNMDFTDINGQGTQAKATITVSWSESGGSYSVPVVVQFAVWE